MLLKDSNTFVFTLTIYCFVFLVLWCVRISIMKNAVFSRSFGHSDLREGVQCRPQAVSGACAQTQPGWESEPNRIESHFLVFLMGVTSQPLSDYLWICQSVNLSICQSINPSTCLSFYMSIQLLIHSSICLFSYFFISLFPFPYMCIPLCIYMSTLRFACVSFLLPVYSAPPLLIFPLDTTASSWITYHISYITYHISPITYNITSMIHDHRSGHDSPFWQALVSPLCADLATVAVVKSVPVLAFLAEVIGGDKVRPNHNWNDQDIHKVRIHIYTYARALEFALGKKKWLLLIASSSSKLVLIHFERKGKWFF